MTVAYDAVSHPSTAAASSLSWSHTCGSTATHLLVGVAVSPASSDASLTTSATYNGVSMTSVAKVHSNNATAGYLEVFALASPATGAAHNVVVTLSGGGAGDSLNGGAVSYSGSGSLGTAVTHAQDNTGGGDPNTGAVTTAPTGDMIFAAFSNGSGFQNSSNAYTSDTVASQVTNGTWRYKNSGNDTASAAGNVLGADAPGAASVTITAHAAADWSAAIAVPLHAAATAHQGQATGSYSWTGAATGSNPGGPHQGQASGSYSFTGTGTGHNSRAGAASGTYRWTGSAVAGTDIGIQSYWFTDYSHRPKLLVVAEDWGLLANGGLNHSGDFAATYNDYFATRAAQGYTAWYGSVFSFYGMSGTPNGADSDGLYPFSTNMDPTTTPNSTFWARRDSLISAAAANGMRAIISLTGPYLHRTDAAQEPQRTWTTTQWTAFGTFIGNRYKNNPNIMWMVGDDYFDDINSGLDALKTALRAAGANHPLSIQYYVETASKFSEWDDGTGGGTPHAPPPGVPGAATAWGANADWNQGYSYNVSYDIVEKAYAWNQAHPTAKVPYGWFDGYFLQNASSPLTDVQLLRRMIWWALSSGSKGFTTGDDDIWPWYGSATIPPNGSLGEIQGTGSNGLFYNNVVPAIASYFQTLHNWHLLEPDLSSTLVTAGRGTHITASIAGGFYGTGGTGDSDNYVTACRTPDGKLAVIYMSKGSTITIDQTKMGAGYTATWVDPKTCATSAATVGSTYNSTAKGNNSDGLNEWVLVLQAPNTGSGSGSYSWPGSATGHTSHSATASGSYQFTGGGTASVVHQGHGVGTYAWTGATTGHATHAGQAPGAYHWTVTGTTGHSTHQEQATGTFAFSGAATGSQPGISGHAGQASGSYAWAGGFTGHTTHSGTAAGTYTFTGSATGHMPVIGGHAGQATGTYAWAGGANGFAPGIGVNRGQGSGTYAWAGQATGRTSKQGSAAGVYHWSGTSNGHATHSGLFSGTFTYVGTASAHDPTSLPQVQVYQSGVFHTAEILGVSDGTNIKPVEILAAP